MSDQTKNPKQKKPKSLDEEIAAAQERLNRLQAQKREVERKALERNQKAITTMLRSEKLDTVPIEEWTAALPALRKLLKVETQKVDDVRTGAKPSAGTQEGKTNAEPLQAAA